MAHHPHTSPESHYHNNASSAFDDNSNTNNHQNNRSAAPPSSSSSSPSPSWRTQQQHQQRPPTAEERYNDLTHQALNPNHRSTPGSSSVGIGGIGGDSVGGAAGTAPGLGSIPLQPGEAETSDSLLFPHQERPTSAPPPPGFASDGAGERARMAEELLAEYHLQQQQHHHHHQQPSDPQQPTHNQQHPSHSQRQHYDQQQQEQHQTQQGGSVSSSSSNAFSNLASVLGTGLAESMLWNSNTPTSNNNNNSNHHSASNMNPNSSNTSNSVSGLGLNNHDDSLNWQRQTRHAASRLLGASPPKHALMSAGGGGGGAPSSTQSGFPSALSTPHRPDAGAVRRATTPVELTAGTKSKRNLHQIGTNVVEPDALHEFSGLNSLVTSHSYGGGGGGATGHAGAIGGAGSKLPALSGNHPSNKYSEPFLWSPHAPEFVPSDDAATTAGLSLDSGGGASQTDLSAQQAEAEIYPFLWDIDRHKPSRTLCILRVGWLRAPDVRNACEAYGVLDSFRSDFSSRGIFFCSYYDIRSAQYAAVELQAVLQRLLILQRGGDEAVVRYCLPLSSSSQFDESQLCLTDLPPQVDEGHLAAMLSSYGAVRSVYPHGPGAFLVEFYSVQDAKQALLELDSSQPWGPRVGIETGARNPVERKRGRELLATLSRWRQQMGLGGGGGGGGGVGGGAGPPVPRAAAQPYLGTTDANDPWGGAGRTSNVGGGGIDTLAPLLTPLEAVGAVGGGGATQYGRQNGTPQLVLGPDGRYQVVMPASNASFGGRAALQPAQAQQIVQGPNGQLYVIPVQNSFQLPQQVQRLGNFQQPPQPPNSYDRRPVNAGTTLPFYTHVVSASDAASLGSGLSYRSTTSASEDKDNRHLMLDLEAVESGIDTRTSLMVRNIPNKYTQQMLLAEFEENGHGPGVIDFFYLPIDFKNRCNRGYAFINFVDFKDILMFHRRYFGKHWRTFNSDKICDITYARIQGKAAMLKRFENSALMEKDDEYKPLVFVSDGPNKGQRLPFPGPSSVMAFPVPVSSRGPLE